MNNKYLMHHGIKDQKWGVRRYQNADGSLTPEGRKHYGVNSANVGAMSDNTKERLKKGGKIGAGVGAGVGVGVAGTYLSGLAAAGFVLNPVGAAVTGAAIVASYAASGALRGALVGGVYGAAETKQARKLMEKHPAKNTKLSSIKKK